MKNGKKLPPSEMPGRRHPKVPPIPPAMLAETKASLHASPKPAVESRWVTHVPIRKEP